MDVLRSLYRYIRKYRYELIAGIAALILTDVVGLLPPWLTKLAIDYIGISGVQSSIKPLVIYSALIVMAVWLQAVFRYYWRKHLFGISRKVEYDLRSDYFRHLEGLHWGFFQHTKTGDIMSRGTNDLQAVREFLGIGSVIIVDAVVIISTCLLLMIVISPKLTFISLLPMIAVSLIVKKFSREIRHRFESVQERLSELSSMVNESIGGIRVIQAYVQEANELKRFKKINRHLVDKNLELTKMSGLLFPMMVLMTGIAATLLLWVGGREVMRGGLTLGSYVAFNGYLLMLTWPMAAVGFMINLSQRGIASMKRIEDIMKIKSEIIDQPSAVSRQLSAVKGEIELKSLKFSYTDKENVLSNINLKIPAGSSLALAGAVGSGKSTVVKLILRIYDATDGAIFIDGIDIKKMPLRLLREIIGYVEQEPFLFSDTIRENIVFGIKNTSDYDIDDAVSMAGLDKDMGMFPHGLDTVIGERGVTLSGGQKQRVALARAIIKKPKVLILDDAFSNLDASTEEMVFGNIRSSLKNTTIILISHRISVLKEADMIAVMKNGSTGEVGTHSELISKGGLYQRIYKKQFFSEMEIVEE